MEVTSCFRAQKAIGLYPDQPCLGFRKIVDGQAQAFTYMMYTEAGTAHGHRAAHPVMQNPSHTGVVKQSAYREQGECVLNHIFCRAEALQIGANFGQHHGKYHEVISQSESLAQSHIDLQQLQLKARLLLIAAVALCQQGLMAQTVWHSCHRHNT